VGFPVFISRITTGGEFHPALKNCGRVYVVLDQKSSVTSTSTALHYAREKFNGKATTSLTTLE